MWIMELPNQELVRIGLKNIKRSKRLSSGFFCLKIIRVCVCVKSSPSTEVLKEWLIKKKCVWTLMSSIEEFFLLAHPYS